MDKQEALRKIEELKQFIQDLDSKSPIERVFRQYLRSHSNIPYGHGIAHDNEQHIMVPLPKANIEWTFKAWDWAKQFCSDNPGARPVHRDEHDNGNYVYIYCGELFDR
jgi:hypothetical protein